MFGISLGGLLVHLNMNAKQFEKTLRTSEKMLESTAKKFEVVGRKMTTFITAPLLAVGGLSVKAFSDFDSAMVESTSIMGNVSAEMDATMRQTARSLAINGKTSAEELAKSYYFLASAGFNAEQSVAALSVVEKFSVAGAFDMANATDLLTDAQSALGLTTKDVASNQENMIMLGDVLVKANILANASVQQFSEALTNEAGPAIKQYNMDLEEGVAILATYADQGLKGNVAGSMFGRMVRMLISSINENGEAFKALGVDTTEFAATGKNLKGVIEGITNATNGLGPAEKAAALESLGFKARIQQAILPLLGATDKIKNYEAALKKAGGITQEVAEKQMKSFGNQMKMLKNNIVDVAITIGDILAPYIEKLNEKIKAAIEYWRSFSKEGQTTIVWISSIAAAIGPLLLIMGSLTKALVSLTIGLRIITMMGASVFPILSGGALAATGVVVILAAKIALIAAALATVTYWLIGSEGLSNAWESVKTAVASFFKFTIGFITNFRYNMGAVLTWLLDNWMGVFQDIGQIIILSFTNSIGNIGTMLKTALTLFYAFVGFVSKMWDMAFREDLLTAIILGFEKAMEVVKTWAVQAWEYIKSIFTGDAVDFDSLSEQFADALDKGASNANFMDTTKDIIKKGIGEMKGPLEGFKSSIKSMPELKLNVDVPAVKNANDENKKAQEKTGADLKAVSKPKEIKMNQYAGAFEKGSVEDYRANLKGQSYAKDTEKHTKKTADNTKELINVAKSIKFMVASF